MPSNTSARTNAHSDSRSSCTNIKDFTHDSANTKLRSHIAQVDVVARARLDAYASTGVAVAVYDVTKFSSRYKYEYCVRTQYQYLWYRFQRSVSRQLHITEHFVVERDSSGVQFNSFRRLSNIYAIVRSWNDPREFTVWLLLNA
jgi:hypothetical protein